MHDASLFVAVVHDERDRDLAEAARRASLPRRSSRWVEAIRRMTASARSVRASSQAGMPTDARA